MIEILAATVGSKLSVSAAEFRPRSASIENAPEPPANSKPGNCWQKPLFAPAAKVETAAPVPEKSKSDEIAAPKSVEPQPPAPKKETLAEPAEKSVVSTAPAKSWVSIAKGPTSSLSATSAREGSTLQPVQTATPSPPSASVSRFQNGTIPILEIETEILRVRSIARVPRGLFNRGNLCFMNSVIKIKKKKKE